MFGVHGRQIMAPFDVNLESRKLVVVVQPEGDLPRHGDAAIVKLSCVTVDAGQAFTAVLHTQRIGPCMCYHLSGDGCHLCNRNRFAGGWVLGCGCGWGGGVVGGYTC